MLTVHCVIQTPETTLPDTLLAFMQARVIQECDLIDGVEDKLVENPLACPFDINSLACPPDSVADNATCLSTTQLSAAKAIYKGAVRSDDPNISL